MRQTFQHKKIEIMLRNLLLASGSAAALTIAASFFAAEPAMAACSVTSGGGTVASPASGAVIDCTGTVTSISSIIGNPTANNVTVTLQNGADITQNDFGISTATAIALGNNANVTINSGATLTAAGKIGYGTALSGGTGLQALILGTVNGTIAGGAGSHITVGGNIANAKIFTSDSILLSGDNSTVTLLQGYAITDNTTGGTSGATNTTLELSGDTGSTIFDTSKIGVSFLNFAKFTKSGAGGWTLTNTPTQAATPWTVNAGLLQIADDASLGNNSSTLTLNGGLVTYTGASVTVTRPIVLGGGALNIATAGTTYTYSGTFSGSGPLSLLGTGTLALPGAQTVGGLVGATPIANSGALTLTGTTDRTYSGIISGTGSLVKTGSFTQTLSGQNSYTGGTTVTGGTLAVTGKTGAVTVAGGALSGTGTVGAVTITSGSLVPGSGGSGKLTTGALTLGSASSTVFALTPSANTSLSVNGTASLNGAAVANGGTGSFAIGTKYTLLTSTGTLSGTFASLSTTGLAAFRPKLSYDANNVFLTLDANALVPLLPASANSDETNLAGAIDRAIAAGANLPSGFNDLFLLSGANLLRALDQISGEISSDIGQAAYAGLMPFLNAMSGGAGAANTQTASNAPVGIHPAQASFGPLNIWTAVYGGYSDFSAQKGGIQPLNTTNFGITAGAEHDFDDFSAGVSLGLGQNQFAISGGQSSGASTDMMLGVYGRAPILDAGYISASLAYGWHNTSITRAVTVGTPSVLRGQFISDDFGGRAEAGYAFDQGDDVTLSPYLALTGNTVSAPAYVETALSGGNSFALSYTAQDYGLLRSELGGRANSIIGFGSGTAALEFHAAWAHQLVQDGTATAQFLNLAGSSFTVVGARMPRESAILGAGLQVTGNSGINGGFRLDSQLGTGMTAVQGRINFGFSW